MPDHTYQLLRALDAALFFASAAPAGSERREAFLDRARAILAHELTEDDRRMSEARELGRKLHRLDRAPAAPLREVA